MKRTLITFAAIAGIVFGLPALAQEKTNVQSQTENGTDGSYSAKEKTSSESTDANGTYSSTQKKAKVNADANGNGTKSTETSTVNDPKGLFNKTKTVTTDDTKVKNGKVKKKHKKTVNGTTVEKSTDTSR